MANLISKRKRARSLALQCLYEWFISDNPLNKTIDVIAGKNKTPFDKEYLIEVVLGCERLREELESTYTPFLDIKPEELDPVEHAILLIGTFEMLHRLDVPYRVVINEALDNTKRFGGTDSHKFINGVLDKVAKSNRPDERN